MLAACSVLVIGILCAVFVVFHLLSIYRELNSNVGIILTECTMVAI